MDYGVPDINTFILIIGFVANAVVIAIKGTRSLGAAKEEILTQMSSLRRDMDARFERQAREIGETVQAIRQKVHDLEVMSLQTFVRRESFFKLTEEIKKNFEHGIGKIEARLDRIEQSALAREKRDSERDK